jgi:lipopolysaccharide/colanic/teichoic acid biosynthesis glycosyltransferase
MKRAFDLFISAIALIVLSPVMLLIVLILLVTQGFPILFCQQRPGKDAHLIKLCKFRTMCQSDKDETGPETDESRITPFGRFLRRSSLDELPELFNVLKGEMSLVGPRPLLIQYLERYTPEQARRHIVLPGITGWAQVNGRNAISWEEKFSLDIWYVDNWSFWLDIRVLLMTIGKVFSGEGISQLGRATMDEFTGSDLEKSK